MASMERIPINRLRSKSGSTVHGKSAILFGSLFALIGSSAMLVAMDVISVDPESIDVPRWFMFLFGLAFGAVGFGLIVHGFRGVARERRRERLLARNPEEPWFADHPWNPRFSMDANLHKLLGYTLGSAFAVAAIGLITWLTFSDPNVSAWVRYLILGIDLIVFLYPVYTAVIWMRYFSHGRSKVVFESFPLFLGERARLRLMTLRPMGADKIKFTLRCIQEEYETIQDEEGQRTTIIYYQLYSDSIEIAVDPMNRNRSLDVQVEFDLPSDGSLTSRLGYRPPRYWELEATADLPGVDYEATFYLPVYAPRQ